MKMNMKLTADELANVMDVIEVTAINNGFDCIVEDDDEFNAIFAIVEAALDAMGISIEEDENEEFYDEDEDEDTDADYDDDYEEEEEDEDEDDPIDSLIYPTGDGHWAINHKDAMLMLQICFERAHKVLSDVLPDETISEIAQRVFTQIMEDWGADRVDVTNMYKENGQ